MYSPPFFRCMITTLSREATEAAPAIANAPSPGQWLWPLCVFPATTIVVPLLPPAHNALSCPRSLVLLLPHVPILRFELLNLFDRPFLAQPTPLAVLALPACRCTSPKVLAGQWLVVSGSRKCTRQQAGRLSGQRMHAPVRRNHTSSLHSPACL